VIYGGVSGGTAYVANGVHLGHFAGCFWCHKGGMSRDNGDNRSRECILMRSQREASDTKMIVFVLSRTFP